jgi:predicted aldo/keto reductase-like oxidoreductase
LSLDSPKLTDGEIIYRTLGKTGIKLPVVSMGVMNADNPQVMKRAYDLGIKHFDTAWRYQSGRNEEMVGKVIREMGIRDDIILATKAPLAIGNRSSYTISELEELRKKEGKDFDKKLKEDYFKTFEESLSRLNQDYVDILYVHSVKDPGTIELPFLLEALTKLKKDGKVRYLGVSSHQNEIPIFNKVIDMGFFDVILAPFNFKMRNKEDMKQVLKKAHDSGLGVVAMKTQAVYDNSRDTNHTAALKYVLQNEYVTTAIPGFTSFTELDEDFSVATNLDYTDDEKAYLKNFGIGNQNGDSACSIPCQQCANCIDSCTKNIDIPDLMRTYMYAAGYHNFEHARITYESIPQDRNLSRCQDCNTCTVKCEHGLDPASNMNQLRALFC